MRRQTGFFRKEGWAEPEAARPKGIRPAWFYCMFTVLVAGNVLSATAFLLAPDIARLLNGRAEQVIAAYEDRISQLRVEVDRLQSRSYAQAGDINLQLQELSQQQEVLLEQHELVRVLVDRADQLGLTTAALPATAPAELVLAPLTSGGNPDIDQTADALQQMLGETKNAMSTISDAAMQRTEEIVAVLSGIGIGVDLPIESISGMGGPLLPAASEDLVSPMVNDANAVMAALFRYRAARLAMELAPIHMPISGSYRQSSGFGNRKDPFNGSHAFHAGLDFAAPSGTVVYAAGTGKVTFVGQKSGYGNIVEITHMGGLVTRYGHLSGFLSEEGQSVNVGTPIAKVGSTGRSTGPHLHFEVRKNDAAIDPQKYLSAGKRLLQVSG